MTRGVKLLERGTPDNQHKTHSFVHLSVTYLPAPHTYESKLDVASLKAVTN